MDCQGVSVFGFELEPGPFDEIEILPSSSGGTPWLKVSPVLSTALWRPAVKAEGGRIDRAVTGVQTFIASTLRTAADTNVLAASSSHHLGAY